MAYTVLSPYWKARSSRYQLLSNRVTCNPLSKIPTAVNYSPYLPQSSSRHGGCLCNAYSHFTFYTLHFTLAFWTLDGVSPLRRGAGVPSEWVSCTLDYKFFRMTLR